MLDEQPGVPAAQCCHAKAGQRKDLDQADQEEGPCSSQFLMWQQQQQGVG